MKRNLDAAGNYEPDWQPYGPSQLFLLRVWEGEMSGQNDWPGMLQQTVTGERRYFKSVEEFRRILSEFMSRRSAGELRDESHSVG